MSPPLLLHHLLDARAADAQRTAIEHGEETASYGDLDRLAAAVARALIAAGVRRGDRVGLFVDRGVVECAAVFGVGRADAVLTPINNRLAAPQARHILEDCGVRALVVGRAYARALASTLAAMQQPPTLIYIDGAPRDDDPPGLALDEFRSGDPLPAARAIGEDLAAILYTSGSTGRPKGVMLSHRNLLAGARIVRSYLDVGREDRILSILPFSFDYGLNQLLTAVEQGAMIAPFVFRMGDDIVRALVRHRITGLAGVPSLWAVLTRAAPSLARTELPHLRYITNSGGSVPSATVRDLRRLLPQTRIFLMYGLTEAFRSTYLPPEEIDRRPTSIGRAIPETEIFLVDASGRPAPRGTPGYLVHRGPTVSLGYWNRPDDTARVIRPNPLRPREQGGDLVCFSGDLAYEDEDGFLHFVGRDDAMIKSSGYRISPGEVEEALMASGQFRQVAVIGLPDSFAGQRVHAVAVAGEGGADRKAALAACADALAPYMMPRDVEIVESLPVTPNGKIDYKRLAAERIGAASA